MCGEILASNVKRKRSNQVIGKASFYIVFNQETSFIDGIDDKFSASFNILGSFRFEHHVISSVLFLLFGIFENKIEYVMISLLW